MQNSKNPHYLSHKWLLYFRQGEISVRFSRRLQYSRYADKCGIHLCKNRAVVCVTYKGEQRLQREVLPTIFRANR